MRETVIIERGDPANGIGMPRPLASNNGTLRPVPWTNGETWGVLEEVRAWDCTVGSLCLVCGETVEQGMIFTAQKESPILPVASQENLDIAADNGPLHDRCAKMTVAHCRHIRNQLHQAEIFVVRYCRQST